MTKNTPIIKTQASLIKKRVRYIDIARGIAILLMIIAHAFGKENWKYGIIYSFHMPLFLLISGYFFKEKPLLKEIWSLFKKLLLPTIILIFIVQMLILVPDYGMKTSFIDTIKTVSTGWLIQDKIVFNFPGVSSLWFIYLLVAMRIIFLINKKISKHNDLLLGLIVTFEAYVGFLAGERGYWLPWSLDVACVCLIFYFVGYLLKKYRLLELILSNWKILLICAIVWIIGIRYNWIEIGNRSYPNGVWSFCTAICGSIIILKLSQIIEHCSVTLTSFLSWCGQNSLYVLFGHYIEALLLYFPVIDYTKSYGMAELACFKVAMALAFGAGFSQLSRFKIGNWQTHPLILTMKDFCSRLDLVEAEVDTMALQDIDSGK